jgi:hypothetical protein
LSVLSGPRVELPDHVQRRIDVWRGAGALVLCALWGWHAFVRNTEVPVLGFLDIAVHEAGHVLFRPFGELVMLIMGSGFEVLFPLLAGLIFLAVKRDAIAFGVCWAWAANTCVDSARYIAEAKTGSYALLGGGPDAQGDWERILGEEFYDKVFLADRIAGIVRAGGAVVFVVATAAIIAAMWWHHRTANEVARLPAPTADGPAPLGTAPSRPLEARTPDDMWR